MPSTPTRVDIPPGSDAPGPPTSPEPSTMASESSATIRIPPVKRPDRRLFIDAPQLPTEQKTEYADLGLAPEDTFRNDIDEVVGEYEEDDELYYYARLSDGVAHKFPARWLRREQPELLAAYERKKARRSLPPFDPSAHYVHPASRVTMILKLGGNRKRGSRSKSIDFEGPLTELDESDFSQDSESSTVAKRRTRRMPTRASKQTSAPLPFSPRKTRSRQVFLSEEEDSDELLIGPTRRSTRSRKSVRDNLEDAYYVEDSDEESDAYAPTTKAKTAKVKKARPKASRPAYGRVRPVADLDYDSDEDAKALRAHRSFCEKCHRQPTHILLAALRKKKGKKKRNEDDDENDEEKLAGLGGWVQCLKCPVAAHWGCLAKTQRDEILKATLERDRAAWRTRQEGKDPSDQLPDDDPEPKKRDGLDPDSTTEFICGSCMKGGVCMACKQVALEPDSLRRLDDATATSVAPKLNGAALENVEMVDGAAEGASDSKTMDVDGIPLPKEPETLLFRCITCKRMAHYEHLPQPDPDEEYSPAELADYYQRTTQWQCADCVSYVYNVEHILAWRPFPENAVEPSRPAGEPPNYKSPLPREYLVKWVSRSYRRTQWVPHMWLVATHPSKLRNFLTGGSHVELLPEPATEEVVDRAADGDSLPAFEAQDEDQTNGTPTVQPSAPSDALPDAERRIRPAWKTVDRVLDILLWYPEKRLRKNKAFGRKVNQADGEEPDEEQERIAQEYDAAFRDGEQPSADLTETVEEWERHKKCKLDENHIGLVVWAFIKWDDLGYEDATWDSPPKDGIPGYIAFQDAFHRFITARSVEVPIRTAKEVQVFDNRPKDGFRSKHAFTTNSMPQLGQSPQLSLMPFQVDGVNWLCNNWWNLQHCILADEMGLGKTVQVVTFIGVIMELQKAFPALVVVPNSTITNWVREFERWAPHLRVCPFYGDAKAREIIKKYELWHTEVSKGTTSAMYHVLVTTYETINGKEFGPVFRQNPRWEVLVVDEGQRLKSDSSLIFRKLKELKTIHRVILTGTPLNNNIRELFNLMNFLNPEEWNDLENLAKEHEVLTDESIKELHNRLRPYFLRRIKSEVLELPPKNEVIVPISMAPLQREVYRSILSQNINLLKTLSMASGPKVNAAAQKTNMNNILMQLRKCLQHPYLVSQDIEPKGLSPQEAHEKLIDASAKLRILRTLLPKLKARGHRVLLFSQFAIALTIIEDFLIGEGMKYLRLDGSTKQVDRQKGMDEFNKPDSDVFIYLLTTRAGGVGINLWSADTVIIFDPDFNPHQDLQAIARAHRYGQKKTCLVFKLMVKDSAEERIMQTGKKKLVLDHLIVQKMDDDDKEDVQSILLFGAQTLFENGEAQASKEIHYSEHDIDNLIDKTEKEGNEVDQSSNKEALFSFAKVWSADKDSLEEMSDETAVQAEQVDSWAQTLERIAAERLQAQEQEATGRGVRRKAAAVFPQTLADLGDTPTKEHKKSKKKGKGKATASDDSDFHAPSLAASDTESQPGSAADEPFLPELPDLSSAKRQKQRSHDRELAPPLTPILSRPSPMPELCGLCGTVHGQDGCYMTESPENLAEYRRILLSHAGDETIEERRAAIAIIDETLYKLGKIHLIYGQPLHIVDVSKYPQPFRRPEPDTTARVPSSFMQNVQTSMQAASRSTTTRPLPKPKKKATGHLAPKPSTSTTPYPAPVPIPKPIAPAPAAVNNAVAGPSSSKRPLSPRPVDSPSKKVKQNGVPRCTICGGRPHAEIKRCPVIQLGNAATTKQEIVRLRQDAANTDLVHDLSKIYHKQKKREALAKPPDVMVLSD
ncbi:unnamed protein product [Somion occarium]|uniref:Chromatin remodeling factor mit1 n=1 Tax=Somion occarium TaxID=3059160 RepID=A0ABP1CHD0_9APHY